MILGECKPVISQSTLTRAQLRLINYPRAQRDCAKDARYMRRLIDALPAILGPIGRHSYDGRLYRCLPWADKTQLDFMVSAE